MSKMTDLKGLSDKKARARRETVFRGRQFHGVMALPHCSSRGKS